MSIFKRYLISIVLVSLAAPSAWAEEQMLRLAHVLSPSEPMHKAAIYYAELVQERSNGRIAIEVFPSGQLGSNVDLYEQVRMGSPVIQISDPGYLSDYVPDFGILNGPYLLDDPSDFSKIIESDWYANKVEELADEHNMRVLSLNWLFGSRHVISNQEIRTPADMTNLSIRVPPNTMWIETFRALGARGETLAWAEVYSGLANSVIDAAEAPLSSLYGSRLYESADVVSLTGHFTAFTGPIMSEQVYQSLPQDMRDMLVSASVEAGEYMANLVQSQNADYRRQLENEGVTFVDDVDVDAFREATMPVYQAFPAWSDGLYSQIQTLLSN